MTGYAMQISSAAIALIKKQQGLSLEKYRDEKGIWVIGYGHVIRQWEKFNGLITPTEAENLLCNDIQLCEALLREMNKRPLTQQQHDALILTLFSFGEESPLPEKILQAVARAQFEREPAAADRADGSPEHHGADHPLLGVGGNLELIGNKG